VKQKGFFCVIKIEVNKGKIISMELKKNKAYELTKLRGLFFNIGLVITLIAVITAFEWKFYDDGQLVSLGTVNDDFEEMLEIPPTEQPPPPPPKIQQPIIVEIPDDEVIEEIPIDLDIEITEESVVQEIILEAAPQEEEVEEIFTIVEEMPSFPGGVYAFHEYLRKNLHYSPSARKMGVEGKVFVQFVVDKKGNISEVEAIRGIGAGLDEEAVRVVKNSPAWNPGKQRGNAVKTRVVIPINFALN
jgi:protein TonB